MEDIVICTIKSWNIDNAIEFETKCKENQTYRVHVFRTKEILGNELLKEINPRYIFFPHWSWMIPKEVYENYECIAFHMTDLPYGRGGSPLQNLILRKIYDTKITAFRVTGELDAGPIYLKVPFNISEGSAESIYRRISEIIFKQMIPEILDKRMEPIEQGQTVEKEPLFGRRTPDLSDMDSPAFCEKNLQTVYDFIRMLDGEGYPKAYLDLFPQMKITFSDAHLVNGKVTGWFEID